MKPHAFVPGMYLRTCVHTDVAPGGEAVTLCGRAAEAPIHHGAPELPGEHDLAAVASSPQSSPAPAHAGGVYPRAAGHGAGRAGAELGCVSNECTEEEGANRDASAGPEAYVPVLPAGSGLVARDSSGSSATPGSQSAVVTLQDDDLSESGVQRRARRQQEVAPDHATGAEGAGPEPSAGPAPAVIDAVCPLAGHCKAIAAELGRWDADFSGPEGADRILEAFEHLSARAATAEALVRELSSQNGDGARDWVDRALATVKQ